MFALKKFVGALASPLLVATVGLLAALVLRRLGRVQAARRLTIVACVVAYVGSITPAGDLLLCALEQQYAPLDETSLPDVRYVVVLGSGYSPRPGYSTVSALDADALARIVEGVRLARKLPLARLVVLGGAEEPAEASALGYVDLARQLGVADESLQAIVAPLDTASEATQIARLIGREPFVLVTSAYHMPRAMRLFQAAGAQPTPAPTGHRVDQRRGWGWRAWLPSGGALHKTEYALHEYLGLLAARLGMA